MLSLCKANSVDFDVSPSRHNRIEEGQLELRDIFPYFDKYRLLFRRHNIMFLEQLVALNGTHLLNWKAIGQKTFSSLSVVQNKPPNWFWVLESFLLSFPHSDSRMLRPSWVIHTLPSNFRGSSQLFIAPGRSKEWVVVYSVRHLSPFFGRIVNKDLSSGTFVMEYWHLHLVLSTSQTSVLARCTQDAFLHLELHHIYGVAGVFNAADAVVIRDVKLWSPGSNLYSFSYMVEDLFSQAYFKWHFNHSIIPFSYASHTSSFLAEDPIARFLAASPSLPILQDIRNSFADFLNFEFYTDGSLIHLGSENLSMSCSFYQSLDLAPRLSFATTIEHWPSSFRSELFAVMLVLLVIPPNSSVTIFSDSQSVISAFDTLSPLLFHTPRHLFKLSNFPIWCIIWELILSRSLTVTFHKVKAHSGVAKDVCCNW